MKKTVFLLLFFLSLGFQTNLYAVGEPLIFTFDDYEFRLEIKNHPDAGKGYRIQKIGETTFTYDAVYFNRRLFVTNCVEIEDYHVFFGYSHDYEGANYYDPLLLVLDKNGSEELILFDDFGSLEEIRDVVIIDSVIFVRIEQSSEDEYGDIRPDRNIILTYDLNFDKLSETELEEDPVRWGTSEYLYMYDLEYDEQGYDGGFDTQLNHLEDTTLPITNHQIFYDSTTILFINEASLNGKTYFHNITIDYPGNYELLYNNYTYRFTVEPTITGIVDNEVYRSSVSAEITSGKAYLNNDLYVSGTPIVDPGNYELKITGINGYEKNISFTITSNVSGVLNDQVYDDEVNINFDGEGYLNNTYIESPFTVSEDGEYVLKIKGEGDYLEMYYFTISNQEEGPTFIDYVQKYDIVFLGVVVIIGGIILKKK